MKKVYSINEAITQVPTVTIGEFLLKLLHAATNGHILHFKATHVSFEYSFIISPLINL